MKNLTTALQNISGENVREIVLQSSDPLEALYRINPEIATVAYAHKEGILNSQVLPYVARFRELQSNEKIALMGALVEQHRTEVFGEVAKYKVDGDVRIVQTQEEGETERTRIVQTGLTRRTEIGETEHTKRKRIEMQGLFDLQKLEYEAKVQMLRDHIDGQKYLSDNQLRAVHAEAEAYKHAIETRESIRAEVQLRTSRDRLEEKIRVAAIEFAQKIHQAETHRRTLQDKNRAQVVNTYLQGQTQLCLDAFRGQVEIELADRRLEEKRIESGTECYKSVQETIRDGLGVIKESISRGRKKSKITIRLGNEEIILDYDSE